MESLLSLQEIIAQYQFLGAYCLEFWLYLENNTRVRGNTIFISSVEHDISQMSAANVSEIACVQNEK